jgi:hypothetical protein
MKLAAAFISFLRALFGADYLPHARATGSVTLVNLSGWQWGIEADETALNVSSYSVAYRPEQKEFARNKSGTKIGFAVDDTEAEISIEAEVTGSTGVMGGSFSAAITVANDHALFGLSAGNVYLDEATESQTRDGFRSVSLRLSKNKNIAPS